jgi:hypothetical protein
MADLATRKPSLDRTLEGPAALTSTSKRRARRALASVASLERLFAVGKDADAGPEQRCARLPERPCARSPTGERAARLVWQRENTPRKERGRTDQGPGRGREPSLCSGASRVWPPLERVGHMSVWATLEVAEQGAQPHGQQPLGSRAATTEPRHHARVVHPLEGSESRGMHPSAAKGWALDTGTFPRLGGGLGM